MKYSFSTVAFIAVVALVAVSRAQIGQNEFGAPPSLDWMALIDTAGSGGKNQTGVGNHRFAIIVIRENSILLDTETGATWRLVFCDSNDVPLRWDPIPVAKVPRPSPAKNLKVPADRGQRITPADDDCDPFWDK